MADHYLRKYATATIVDFALYKLDGTGLKVDAASATHDIKIMKDEGNEADTTADAFVDEGQGYSLALTATEMTAARIVIYIVDQGTQVWLDKCLIIETYGNASAQHAFDLATATQNVNVASVDNIDFGATMKASINTEVDNALNTAIPASNTATSVNDILLDVLTLAAINTQVDDALNTAVPASNTTNSVNDLLLDQIDPTADAVKAKTDLIPADIATQLDTNVPAIKAKTDLIPADIATQLDTNIPAIKAITDLLTLGAIADAVQDEALSGHTGAGSAGLALQNILKIGKNKWTISGTTFTIYDDNGSSALYTFTLDDGTSPTSRTPA
jgi:hypothetical protein